MIHRLLTCPMIMIRLISDNEGDVLKTFFSCSCVSGRWWLSDIGSSQGADEGFLLSSLTQGYGSILLSKLFLSSTAKLLPLSLYSTSTSSSILLPSFVWFYWELQPCLPSSVFSLSQSLNESQWKEPCRGTVDVLWEVDTRFMMPRHFYEGRSQ